MLRNRLLRGILIALIIATSLTSSVNAVTWGPVNPVIVDWRDNLFPNILQTSNGSVWLAFQKSSAASEDDIYLMVNNGFGWSGEIPLVVSPDHDVTPSMVELNNGTIVMVWPGKRAGDYDLYSMSYTNNRWSNPSLLVQGVGDDYNPSMVRTPEGRVWLAWSRSTLANGGGDLYYRIFNGISWGPEQAFQTSTYEEKFPSLTQTKDGRIWMVWESNSAGGARLFYRTYNGTAWTNTSTLTTTNDLDKWPYIVQDRNGVIWVFWGRELPTSDPLRPFQWDLFYKFSTNNGATWSADTTIAPEGATDDWHPSVIQGKDRALWVVWSSDRPSLYGTHNIYVVKSDPVLTHDVAVRPRLPEDRPRLGTPLTIWAEATNLGDYSESTTLTLSVDGQTIGSTTVSLSAASKTTITYTWNTAGRPLGAHTVQATTTQVTGETNPWDNSAISRFHIVPSGDVERNGMVNVLDLASVGVAFGSRPGETLFNPHADLNQDSGIDIIDMAQVGTSFGLQAILPPDFSLTASKYQVRLSQGSSADITISANPISGLTSPFFLTVSGVGVGVTSLLTPHFIQLPGTSTLRLEATSNPVFGTYTTVVTATNGTYSRSLNITLIVSPPADFQVAASPASLTLVQGATSTSTITISSLYAFNSPVSLTASGMPSGVTASFAPASVTPPADGSITSTLTLAASSSATVGPATLTVTGTNNGLIRTTTLSLTVQVPPGLSVSASPTTITLIQGQTAATTVTVSSIGGFSSPTTLTVTGLSTGVTASFSTNPVTPPPNGAASSIMTLTATSTATTGTFTITITGTSGSLTHSVTVSLTVKVPPDFSLGAIPTSLSINKGSSSPVTITVTSVGDFSQPVSLTVSGLPSGVAASFSANPVTPPANGPITTIMTLLVSSTATAGTFTLTVTGTSGSLQHTVTVSLTVNPNADFSLNPVTSSLTVVQGSTSSLTIIVTSTGSFEDPVTLSTSTLPAGATSWFNPNPVTPPAGGSASSSAFFSASASTPVGTYTVTISGTNGTLVRQTTITLQVDPAPDFTISASPTSLTITRSGAPGVSTITLSSVGGFASPVTLSVSGVPSGVTASFSPNPVSPPGTSTLSLTASSSATLGTFTITITGTGGSLVRSTTISLSVNPNPFSGATIIYAGGTPSSTPRERTWDGTAWTSESSLTDTGSAIRWIRTVYSTSLSRPSEKIVVTLSADGFLDAYVWNGNTWSVTNNIASVGTVANAYRSFDLVYEKTAGRVLLAYSSGGGSADIGYRIWDGASWLGPYTLDFTASVSGSRINWVSMAAKPLAGSNEIALIAIDGTNSDVYGAIWNGAAWSSQQQLDTTVSIATEEAIAVEYEQLSGYATFVWGVSTDNSAIKSRQWSGTAWDPATISINGTNGNPNPNWIVLAADPVSDRLMLLVIDDSSDLNTASWSGSAWTVHTEHDSAVNTNANRAGSVVWEPTGSKALLVWATDTTNLSYKTWTPSGGWTATSTFNYDGADGRWVQAKRDPRNMGSAKILIAVSDINLDLFLVRWDGTGLSTGVTATTSLPSNSYESFSISLQAVDESGG